MKNQHTRIQGKRAALKQQTLNNQHNKYVIFLVNVSLTEGRNRNQYTIKIMIFQIENSHVLCWVKS